ncbi:DoxX family protein [Micromonospora sp. NPDC005324]|uniref:DoxX family protein n=1 Tax=Micromonospora sp. NPDC005324 TaxID=3157033 RepID=UPI0033B5B746
MEPLIALVVTTLVLLGLGAVGVSRLRPWSVALRGGLAAMFVVTGTAHFVGLRESLIDMVPPAFPAPGLLVTVTGVLELCGAVGLLWHRTVLLASGGLTLLLVAVFPANVHAAAENLSGRWDDELVPRTILQVIFLAATIAVLSKEIRNRRQSRQVQREEVVNNAS